jgi:rsbT co-antagonist protein RsbR
MDTPGIESLAWDTPQLLQAAIDVFPDPIFVKNRNHQWVAVNAAFCALLGQPASALYGKSDPDFLPPEQAAAFWEGDDALFATGEPSILEETIRHPDGSTRTIWTRKYPLRDAAGHILGLSAIITDITPLQERQSALQALEQQLAAQREQLDAQAVLLEELAVPVIVVQEGVLLLPLIGSVDSRRAQQVLETMLTAISTHQAHHLLLDISGVPIVDTGVAAALLQSVRAAQLLGCATVLVGISPEIAQTLVGLGIDFGGLTMRASLQQALQNLVRS